MITRSLTKEYNQSSSIIKIGNSDKLIRNFVKLRHELHQDPKLIGFRNFSSNTYKDYKENNSHLFAITEGKKCIGGLKLTLSYPDRKVLLPLEESITLAMLKPIKLKELLSDIQLENVIYGEFSRLVLHPNYRDGMVLNEIFSVLSKQMIDKNVSYIFVLTDILRMRKYRQLLTDLGIKNYVLNNIKIPDIPNYEGKKMHLMVGDLRDKLKG